MDLLLEDDRIRERQREENRARKRNIKRLLKVQDKKGKLGGHDRTGTRVTDDTPLKAPPNLSTSTAATSATAATSSSRTSVRLPQSSDSNSGRLVKSPTEETVLGSTTSSMDLPSRPAQALPKIDSGRAKRVKTSNILKNTSQILGSGAHGTVYLGLNTVNGELVAIKEISFQKMGQNSEEVRQQINNIVREIALMKALDHPNIVPYYGAERNKQTLQIVMEYIPGGSLKSIIQHFGHLHERVVRRYGGQMLCGLEYLHGQGVAHLDIKNDNALLAVTGEVKLADFGGSEKFAGGNLSTKTVGTPLFMAPEVIKGTGHSVSADIWSLGITFIELLAGEAPMYGIRDGFAVMFKPAEPMWGVGDAKTMIKVNSKTESELNGTFANTSSRAKLARAARKAFNVSKVMYPNGFADLDVLQSFVSFSSSFAVSNDENDTSYLRTLKAQQQQGLITAFELKTKKTALFGLSSSDSLVRCGTSAAV
ncbi:Mitogen-activated protein kinase kinase kinase 2 [Diplonema papillatum]|nr:Mitogen-activated protein kinase kinase kinase 2 [Diplonema papillatum]